MAQQPTLAGKPAPRPVNRTAEVQDVNAEAAKWHAVEADTDFQQLVSTKRSFILPATVFFIVYYFALPVLVGYFPSVMSRNVIGHINLAYLFALSQFFMAWIIMALYVKEARVFDSLAEKIRGKVRR